MAQRPKRSAPRFGVYRPTREDTFLFRGVDRPQPGGSLRVATWNMHFGAGSTLDDARRFPKESVEAKLDEIATLMREQRVDILGLQEVDRDSQRSDHVDQLEFLRHATGLTHASFATTWDAAWVPYPVTAPPRQQYGRMWAGQAVLSRFPIVAQHRHALAQPARFGRIYNRFYLHRCIQEVTVELGEGKRLTVFNIHLEAFDMANRRAQARALARLMRRVEGPGLALGDLNTVGPEAAWRHRYPDEPETDFRGDDTLPTLRATGWVDVGEGATFPAEAPTRRLDYVFGSPDLELTGGAPLASLASDHLPLVVELGL